MFNRKIAIRAMTIPATWIPRILSLNKKGHVKTGITGARLTIGNTREAGPPTPRALYNIMFPKPAVTPVASAKADPFPMCVPLFKFLENSNTTAKGTKPPLERICTSDPESPRLAKGESRLHNAQISMEIVA